MEQPIISVIIPVYNSERYLTLCLDSICNNSYRNLQIICINDGSTDSSLEILTSYANKDQRFLIINQNNSGVSTARNTGISNAVGDYIAFIDSDDRIHPNYFEYLFTELIKTEADITNVERIRTPDIEFNLDNVNLFEKQAHIIDGTQFFRNTTLKYYIWGKLLKREIIGNIRFNTDLKIAEDTFFIEQILLSNSNVKISYSEATGYIYNDHNDSAIHVAKSKDKLIAFEKMLFETLSHDESSLFNNYIGEIIKQLLSLRYACKINPKNRHLIKSINRLMEKCFCERKNSFKKNDIILFAFYKAPFLYRRWRLYKDPSLKKIEMKYR